MTIPEQIEAALFAHTLTLDVTGDPPIAWEGMDFDPPAGPYVRAEIKTNRNTRLFMTGSDPHLRQGILQLTVVMPIAYLLTVAGGLSLTTEMAGEIAEHFPADLALFEDDIKVRVQKAPDVHSPDKTDVSWDRQVDVYFETFA